MPEQQETSLHPLDGCDEDECYRIMMAERSVLIAAQRDSQDSLIKTVIQLSSALIALMSGLLSQSKFAFSGASLYAFSISLVLFCSAILCGLCENIFSSRAYREQQSMLEQYYVKVIADYSDPKSNKIVRKLQLSSFATFVLGLLFLGVFGILEAKGKNDVKGRPTAASAPPTTVAASSPASARAIQ